MTSWQTHRQRFVGYPHHAAAFSFTRRAVVVEVFVARHATRVTRTQLLTPVTPTQLRGPVTGALRAAHRSVRRKFVAVDFHIIVCFVVFALSTVTSRVKRNPISTSLLSPTPQKRVHTSKEAVQHWRDLGVDAWQYFRKIQFCPCSFVIGNRLFS